MLKDNIGDVKVPVALTSKDNKLITWDTLYQLTLLMESIWCSTCDGWGGACQCP